MKWDHLKADNAGAPFACPSYPIKSIQVLGTFAGAVCSIEGSNVDDKDTATYMTLNNLQGNALGITGATIRGIQENTYWVRPNVTGGDGTTDLTVYLLCVTER